MLTIEIDGKELFIKKDTKMLLEVKNSAFDTEKIDGDIIFTFDIPVEKNDVIFKHAHHVYVQRVRKYNCTISFSGIVITKGDLYLQKASQSDYSCGVIVNPFKDPDFPNKKLRENEFGEDLVISTNYTDHKQKWLEFLKQSLDEKSPIRFPLFKDDEFYDSGNIEFGVFEETVIGKLLNRLYINGTTGDIMNEFSPSINIFNSIPEDTSLSWNSYAFAPAFHLLWLLGKVIENSGYRLIGNFKDDDNVKKILFQSLRSLDRSAFDYAELIGYLYLIINNDLSGWQPPNNRGLLQLLKSSEYGNWETFDATTYSFIVKTPGIVDFNFNIETKIPPSVFGDGDTDFGDHIYLLFSANYLPSGSQYVNFENFKNVYPREEWYNKDYVFQDLIIPAALSGFTKDPVTGYRRGNITFQFTQIFSESDVGKKIQFYWGYITWKYDGNGIHNNFYYIALPTITNTTIYTYKDTDDFYDYSNPTHLALLRYGRGRLNIYDNKLKYSDHMPNLTNSEFLNVLCELFGLSYFIDSRTKCIELSFFKDILKAKKTLDLSEYVVRNSETIDEYTPTKYGFGIDAVNNKDISAIKKISPVQSYHDLPYPEFNLGKYCFVVDENRYYLSQKNDQNWVISWQLYAGNDNTLVIGKQEDESEEIKPKIKTPENDSISYAGGRHIYPEINLSGLSRLFETEQVDFDMILLTYLGIRVWRNNPNLDVINFVRATPVCFDRDGNREAGCDITATGENSIGELYVNPWLDFKSSYETINYNFLFPPHVFLSVLQLLRPQTVSVDRQIRWVMVNNIKLLPISMDFEFSNENNLILSRISFARKKLEL